MGERIHTEPTGPGARTLQKLKAEIEEEKKVLASVEKKQEAASRISRTYEQHQVGRLELPDQKIHTGAAQLAEPSKEDVALAKKVAEVGAASKVLGVAHDLAAEEIKQS